MNWLARWWRRPRCGNCNSTKVDQGVGMDTGGIFIPAATIHYTYCRNCGVTNIDNMILESP